MLHQLEKTASRAWFTAHQTTCSDWTIIIRSTQKRLRS